MEKIQANMTGAQFLNTETAADLVTALRFVKAKYNLNIQSDFFIELGKQFEQQEASGTPPTFAQGFSSIIDIAQDISQDEKVDEFLDDVDHLVTDPDKKGALSKFLKWFGLGFRFPSLFKSGRE